MKKIYAALSLFVIISLSYSQDTTGTVVQHVVQVNDAIEKALLDRNAAALDTLFGDDLLFSHGGGNVDNKISYTARVPKSFYSSRVTDSTRVEVHDNAAVVLGRIIVHNGGEKPKPPY